MMQESQVALLATKWDKAQGKLAPDWRVRMTAFGHLLTINGITPQGDYFP